MVVTRRHVFYAHKGVIVFVVQRVLCLLSPAKGPESDLQGSERLHESFLIGTMPSDPRPERLRNIRISGIACQFEVLQGASKQVSSISRKKKTGGGGDESHRLDPSLLPFRRIV